MILQNHHRKKQKYVTIVFMKWSLLNSSVFTIYHVVTVQWITADYFADVVFYLFRDALLRRTILLASLDKCNVCLYGCARMLLNM